jgi:hypothetical protein
MDFKTGRFTLLDQAGLQKRPSLSRVQVKRVLVASGRQQV